MGDPVDTVDGVPLYADYKIPLHLRPAAPSSAAKLSWLFFMAHWEHVQADLMEIYGMRDDRAADYSWPFFRNLVWGLLTTNRSRMFRIHQQENP